MTSSKVVWDSSALSAPNRKKITNRISVYVRLAVFFTAVDDDYDNDNNVNKLSCLNAFQFK